MPLNQLSVESSVEGMRRVLLIRQFDMTEGLLPRPANWRMKTKANPGNSA